MKRTSSTDAPTPNLCEIEVELCPSRLEANETSEKYGNMLGPGTKYNQSVGTLLGKMQSKGVRVALRNPRAPDGVTVVFLTWVGLRTLKIICDLLSTWIKAKSGRTISIANGRRFQLNTTGVSQTDVAELIKLAAPRKKVAALVKSQNQKPKSAKPSKKKH